VQEKANEKTEGKEESNTSTEEHRKHDVGKGFFIIL